MDSTLKAPVSRNLLLYELYNVICLYIFTFLELLPSKALLFKKCLYIFSCVENLDQPRDFLRSWFSRMPVNSGTSAKMPGSTPGPSSSKSTGGVMGQCIAEWHSVILRDHKTIEQPLDILRMQNR